jgi:hypothetical protein
VRETAFSYGLFKGDERPNDRAADGLT